MNTLRAILFSRDRAMQLDATLSSFFLHCTDADRVDLFVLYHATDARHAKQYALLAEAYTGVQFVPQVDFRQDLLRLTAPGTSQGLPAPVSRDYGELIGFGPDTRTLIGRIWKRTARRFQFQAIRYLQRKALDDKYVLFLVDDNIFIRDFRVGQILTALTESPRWLGFSLRLGTNTTFCYPFNRTQRLPDFTGLGDDLLQFDWSISELDFGYPLEVSSSVYRLSDIRPLILVLRFQHPNDLEEQMATSVGLFRSQHPLLGCFRTSVTFCNPVNKAQSHFPNRAGEDYAYAIEELADRFEAGERIDVLQYSGFVPVGCHHETELIFKPAGRSK